MKVLVQVHLSVSHCFIFRMSEEQLSTETKLSYNVGSGLASRGKLYTSVDSFGKQLRTKNAILIGSGDQAKAWNDQNVLSFLIVPSPDEQLVLGSIRHAFKLAVSQSPNSQIPIALPPVGAAAGNIPVSACSFRPFFMASQIRDCRVYLTTDNDRSNDIDLTELAMPSCGQQGQYSQLASEWLNCLFNRPADNQNKLIYNFSSPGLNVNVSAGAAIDQTLLNGLQFSEETVNIALNKQMNTLMSDLGAESWRPFQGNNIQMLPPGVGLRIDYTLMSPSDVRRIITTYVPVGGGLGTLYGNLTNYEMRFDVFTLNDMDDQAQNFNIPFLDMNIIQTSLDNTQTSLPKCSITTDKVVDPHILFAFLAPSYSLGDYSRSIAVTNTNALAAANAQGTYAQGGGVGIVNNAFTSFVVNEDGAASVSIMGGFPGYQYDNTSRSRDQVVREFFATPSLYQGENFNGKLILSPLGTFWKFNGNTGAIFCTRVSCSNKICTAALDGSRGTLLTASGNMVAAPGNNMMLWVVTYTACNLHLVKTKGNWTVHKQKTAPILSSMWK